MSVTPVSNLPIHQDVQGADRRSNLTQPGKDLNTAQQASTHAPELSATIVTLTSHQPMPPVHQGPTAAPPITHQPMMPPVHQGPTTAPPTSHQPMPPDYQGKTAAPPAPHQPMPPVHKGNTTTSAIPEGKVTSGQ